MPSRSASSLPKLAYSVKEVSEVTGIPPSTVYDLVASGRLPARRISKNVGARIVVLTADLDQFLAELPEDWGGYGSYTFRTM